MTSDSVRLTSIGVRITEPLIRSAAARMSSIVGGCMLDAFNMSASARPSARPGQCYAPSMPKSFLALSALLLASSALADTLISNVNGIQVGPDGKLQHFGSLLVGDDGRVKQVMAARGPR